MEPAGTDWIALQRAISGDVVLPGSDAYDRVRKPFIARFDDVAPAAVVRCAVREDAAEAIAFARRYGIEVAIRSGGHCLAGHSSTRGILIDLKRMDSVEVADGVLEVGAGIRTGELADRLFEQGLALPTGTCPSVGLAGLALGGGIGILGRAFGLTLDHMLAAEIVLADGHVMRCDRDHDAGLFWALRGAGAGNFGVVTSFAFEPRPAPRMSSFHLTWRYADAAGVVEAWQRWAPHGPDELSADLVLSASGDPSAAPGIEVYGAVLGTEGDATALLDDLTSHVGADPRTAVCRELSFRETCAHQAELSVAYDQVDPIPGGSSLRQGHRYTKSELFARALTTEAIAALVRNVAEDRVGGQARSVGFAPWGGAYNRRSPRDAAFAHRDQLFSLEHIVVVDPAAPEPEKRVAREWVGRSWRSVRQLGSGRVYPCFPDAELDDWQHAYYGQNYARLVEIKARYDPGNLFRFDQSIPTG